MDIRKGNDVNVYFELSKIGVPSAESVKGIRCFFAKDVRSESGDVPVPPSCNPSSYVIHDHMHPGYNVHMPYRSITLHVHREFCVPDNCPPGWNGPTVFVVTDYKIVNIEKEGEIVPYLRVAFGGDKLRNGRYNIVLEIVYIGTDDQGRSDVKCTYDYGHQFDLTDQITALSGRIDIWLTDQKDIYTKVEELEEGLAQEIERAKSEEALKANYIDIRDYSSDGKTIPYGKDVVYTYGDSGSAIVALQCELDSDEYLLFNVSRDEEGSLDIVAFKKNDDYNFEFFREYRGTAVPDSIRRIFFPKGVVYDLINYITETSQLPADDAGYVYNGHPVELTARYTCSDGDTEYISFCVQRYDDASEESGKIYKVIEYTYDNGTLYFHAVYERSIPDYIQEVFNEAVATQVRSGLMSAADKSTVDRLAPYTTEVTTNIFD